MPIAFSDYVNIISGVGGNNAVRQRDLITRIFTDNALVPTGGFVEFTSAADVGAYFGTTSAEYFRAVFYFGWISKNITSPQKISYARWADAATAPQIFGDKTMAQALASWTSIMAGTFSLSMGGVTNTIGPIDFSGAGSLSAVATDIQTAIRTKTGSLWTAATVTWDSTRGAFELTGGVTGPNEIAVAAGTGGSDIAAQLGWLSVNTILSDGVAIETITQTLTNSAALSNNFGSFLFLPSFDQAQVVEATTWTDGQNVRYMYLVPLAASAASATSAATMALSGASLNLSPLSTEYPEMVPGMIMAATDYTARASVQNYMFQTNFPLTPSVTDTTTAQNYDAIRVNYYGNTQTAGQVLSFYQRGTLTGGSTAPVDQNVYANEMWLKDAAGAAIMSLLLSLAVVSANKFGIAQVTTTLQSVIDAALFNGTISVGKTLNNTQQLFVTQTTGDPLAWHQVQNIGYWLGVTVQSYVTTDGRTEWKVVYTLLYSKDDAIRKVEGSHELI